MAPFYCHNCGFVLYQNTAAAVAAIIHCQGNILFTLRNNEPAQGMLDLPGGFVDPKESLTQALTREVYEELGLEIKDWQFLCSYPNQYPYKGIRYDTCDAIFTTNLSQEPKIKPQKAEIQDVKWLAKDKIVIEDMGFQSLQNAVRDYLKTHA